MRVVSLFSGSGGLDLGFRQAGFDLIWAVDNYPDAVASYQSNLGSHVLQADVRTVDVGDVPEADIVIGGFPCQGFSVANVGRSRHDERNGLYLEFVRFVKRLKPRFFVAENVKGILSLARGQVFAMILADFQSAGFRAVYSVLRAADYGVPQNRERVFLLGMREDLSHDLSLFPPPRTHIEPGSSAEAGLLPWMSVGEALSGLPDPDSDHDIPNHDDYSKYKLRFNGYLGHRRVCPDRPAPTLTARGDMRGGVVVIHHPSNERRITPREAAIIQGFPSDYRFEGSRTSCYRQIANAVPPPMAAAVAASVRRIASSSEQVRVRHGTHLTHQSHIQFSIL